MQLVQVAKYAYEFTQRNELKLLYRLGFSVYYLCYAVTDSQ